MLKEEEIKFEIDLNSNIIVGTTNLANNQLQVNIANALKEAFSELGKNDWILDFIEKINNQDIEIAYNLFLEKKGLLQFFSDESKLEKLRSVNLEVFDKSQKKSI